MSFDNNSFYDDNSTKNWQPQPTPMEDRRRRHTGKWVTAILILGLLALAVTGTVHLVRDVGVTINRSDTGFLLTVGTQPAQTAPTEQTQTAKETEPSVQAEAPAQTQQAAEELPQLRGVVGFLKDRLCCAAQAGDRAAYSPENAARLVSEQFGEDTVNRLAESPLAVQALGGLLAYLKVTQFTGLERLLEVTTYLPQEFMRLDVAARRNLELTETMRNREKRGTLFWVLDKTKTSMGRRLLRSSIEQPLLSVNAINRRLHAVTELTRNSILISELAAELDGVYDLERLMTRVVYGNPPVKDMIALGQTAMRLPAVKELLGGVQCALLREIEQNIDPLEDVARLIGAAIDPDDSTPLKEGGVIRTGYDKQLDEARHLSKDIRGILAEIEEREKDATGIRTLRIGYNRAADLIDQMCELEERIQSLSMGKPVWYMNRTVKAALRKLTSNRTNVQYTPDQVTARPLMTFNEIPVHICDAITDTETLVK